MRIRTPRLPKPKAIREEIEALQSRIGELRTLLPLAEAQQLRRSIRQSESARKAMPK